MSTYTGEVYDIDFLSNQDFTQVLIRGSEESPAFITKEPRIQTVLAAALLASRPVTVDADDKSNRIMSVSVKVIAEENTSPGQVLELNFAEGDGRCTAVVTTENEMVTVYTMDPRPQSILETAFAHSLPVDYLTYEENERERGKITRVKINRG